MIKSAANESFLIWWAKWQKQNAEALKELQQKHGVRILRTPPEILVAFLKTWDKIAAEEAQKSPFFKKMLESQRQYASLVVPAKRFYFPPYSFAANYYLPEGEGERPRKRTRNNGAIPERGRRFRPRFSFGESRNGRARPRAR